MHSSNYDPIAQHLTIEKFLGHEVLVQMLFDFLVDPIKVKLTQSIKSNLKEDMINHLARVKKSKIVMAKDIVYTLATSSNLRSKRGVVDLIGVDMKNLRRSIER